MRNHSNSYFKHMCQFNRMSSKQKELNDPFLNQMPYNQNPFVRDNAAEHRDLETHYGRCTIYSYHEGNWEKKTKNKESNRSKSNKVKLEKDTEHRNSLPGFYF